MLMVYRLGFRVVSPFPFNRTTSFQKRLVLLVGGIAV